MRITSILRGGAIASVLLGPAVVRDADAKVSLTLAPSSLEVAARPNTNYRSRVLLINEGDGDLIIELQQNDFLTNPETGTPDLLPAGSTPGSASGWVALERANARLAPGERIEIPFVIAVPRGVPDGGYYAAVRASARPAASQSGGIGTAFEAAIVSKLYVVVGTKTIRKSASLGSLRAARLPDGIVEFDVPVTVDGNVHVPLGGVIEIRDEAGASIARLVQPTRHPVLPGTARIMKVRWTEPPPAGRFHAIGVFDCGLSVPLIGRLDFELAPIAVLPPG